MVSAFGIEHGLVSKGSGGSADASGWHEYMDRIPGAREKYLAQKKREAARRKAFPMGTAFRPATPEPKKRRLLRKSFIPGQGFKEAHLLTSAERATVRATKGRLQPGVSHSAEARLGDIRQMYHGLNSIPTISSPHPKISFAADTTPDFQAKVLAHAPKHLRRPVVVHDATRQGIGLPDGVDALTARRAGGPHHIALGPHASGHTIAHEFVHANVKSNGGRLMAIAHNTEALSREEARADAGSLHRLGGGGAHGIHTSGYEEHAALVGSAMHGNRRAGSVFAHGGPGINPTTYAEHRQRLGMPIRGVKSLDGPRDAVAQVTAGEKYTPAYRGRHRG